MGPLARLRNDSQVAGWSASVRRDDPPPSIHYGDAMADFIYQTRKVRKASSDKVILDGDTVNSGPGAKARGVGPNGTSTSNVPRVISAPTSPECCSNPASSRLPNSRHLYPPPKPRAHKQESARRLATPRRPHLVGCAKPLRCNRICGRLATNAGGYRGL